MTTRRVDLRLRGMVKKNIYKKYTTPVKVVLVMCVRDSGFDLDLFLILFMLKPHFGLGLRFKSTFD